MLYQILVILPTVLAIMSLAMFNRTTRWFCYTLVSLCVIAELIPTHISIIALVATLTALIALITADFAQRINVPKHN